MEINDAVLQIANSLVILCVGFYLIQNLQWYNYSFTRIISKHTKPQWNLIYFILPLALFFIFSGYTIIILIIYIIALIIWYKKLDKKLVLTHRVQRFFVIFIILLGITLVFGIKYGVENYWYFLALIVAFIISFIGESAIIFSYRKMALFKLESMPNLTIIAITASFGKTSIKNFLAHILSSKYRVYSTPRSVNTLNGIISDINNNLQYDCEIYIAEAGARNIGDIEDIATFLNHHYAIIGEIGAAHISYFKTLQNIITAKYELVKSTRLKEVFLYKDNENLHTSSKVTKFPQYITNVNSTLESTSFSMKIDDKEYEFHTKILGDFNITNLSVAIILGYKLGVNIKDIIRVVEKLDYVPHRLEKLEVNGKIILDDSFNGNLNGMREAIRLSSLHNGGKKIIVTPGLIESNIEYNITLAKLIDEVFDIAIITGDINSQTLSSNISKPQKIILKDKAELHGILSSFSSKGDLILFANDAPSYV